MKKSEVRFHADRPCCRARPAVNVRARNWPLAGTVATQFGCDVDTAAKALEKTWEDHCQAFWKNAQEIAELRLGPGVKVWQEGRSGGWLVVEGLHEFDTWDAIAVSAWSWFVHAIERERDWQCSMQSVSITIALNDWTKRKAA